mmetsp:Transcript_19195/g.38675  ORF Transcript_19195/g.38675 Transcript_19195/m.38675 type:complete len:267 (+) Transcript_19195:401-1201(+)
MTLIDYIDEYITEKERRWIALLLCLNALLWYALKHVEAAKGRELNLAYPLVSLVATLQFVKYGCGALFDGSMMAISTDAYTRLKAEHDGFADLAQITFAYEVFNTLSAVILPEYRTGEFLGHHILTMMIAKCSQKHGPEFYGLFYLGIAAVSTLPLIVVDIFRHGPKVLAETYPTINTIARVLFAVSFLTLRAATWPLVSLVFWHDAIINLMNPPEDGGTWRPYLIGLLLSNTFLGALQVIWAGRIWKGLTKVLKKDNKQKASKSS